MSALEILKEFPEDGMDLTEAVGGGNPSLQELGMIPNNFQTPK